MKLFTFDCVDSTMISAKHIIDTMPPDGFFCVLAYQQNVGKGTLGRRWASPIGNFYATYCFPYDASDYLFGMSIRVGFSVIKALAEYGVKAKIKWANDILIDLKKVAGILCEVYQSYIMIGIGINFNIVPNVDETLNHISFFQPTSIKSYYDMSLNISDFSMQLGKILAKDLFQQTKNRALTDFQKYWKTYSATFNREINFILPSEIVISGKEMGITQEGFLIIKQQTAIETYHSGRIIDIIA